MVTARSATSDCVGVEEIALDRWGLRARAEPLPGDEDCNFLLRAEDGERFVLKISSGEVDPEVITAQNAILRQLEGRDCGFEIPRVKRGLDGADLQLLADGSRVRLLTYLDGTSYAGVACPSPAFFAHLGRSLARLDQALEDVHHQPVPEPGDDWSPLAAGLHRRFVERVAGPDRRRIADEMLRRFDALALPLVERLPRALIHGDANDWNTLVEERSDGRTDRVSGLLDFSDSAVTARVCEPAIACAYMMLRRDDPLAVAAALVAGYHDVAPLTELEIEALLPLAAARLVISVLTAARRRRRGSDNEYHFLTEGPAWRTLAKLETIRPLEAENRLREACGMDPREPDGGAAEELLARRRKLLGRNLSLSYSRPLEILRGHRQYLFDEAERPYLDLVNNVCHVGHCHPRVVGAASRQMRRLNTNTRYLHPAILEYAERLTATMPEPLSVCFFVCSGSEANELAVRLARTHTGRHDMAVLDGAYHGHSATLIDLSPYKFAGPGGRGRPEWVHVAPLPDPYRNPAASADDVQRLLADAAAAGRPVAGLLCESLLGCGGQIVPPPGYLAEAFDAARAAGAVAIADEVQVGFGRVGSHFWAFEAQAALPDVVTLGKPIGNGHPLAAVVTTPEIADSFANGMEFFDTFGGNPVSCAVGLAVLDVIEQEGLMEHAATVGERLLAGLSRLAERHALIGDVRGLGLFCGVELVTDRTTKAPASEAAAWIVERMKEAGVLLSTDGPFHNVIKIKPPLVISPDDVDLVARQLDRVLADWERRQGRSQDAG